MALMPKRIPHRKTQRGKIKGHATRGNTVAFGDYGVQAMEPGWISARQIEAGRLSIVQTISGEGKYWIRVFPHKPISSKPLEVRMGKGKGEPDFWAAVIKPGTILYEISGVPEAVAKAALAKVAYKMPIRCKLALRRSS